MKFTFSVKAYLKILLHACKYPHKAVNGVLLSGSIGSSNDNLIVDAIPLFHQCLGLAPMLEVALAQVRLSAMKFIASSANYLTYCHFYILQ